MPALANSLRHLRDWTRCALDLAFPWPDSAAAPPVPIVPPYCRQCGAPFSDLEASGPEFTCAACLQHDWHFLWARAAHRLDGQVHEAVVGFKYEEQFYQRAPLVAWLTEAYDRHAAGIAWDALVPVPLYHLRRRERGFNQARELADGLASRRQIAVWDCLLRDRETPSQTGLERHQRWDNMEGAFRLKGGFDLSGRNLLLIDDVFTTGATTNACARALAEAGAGRLAVLTVARSGSAFSS